MKVLQSIIIILLCSHNLIQSQNLVSNPSFETITKPSKRWMGNYADFKRIMSDWHSPTQGSPDVLHVDYLSKLIPQRPNVDIIPHKPRTGNVMTGIKTFGCEKRTQHCKEYLQISAGTEISIA